jgi:hypothetical protein
LPILRIAAAIVVGVYFDMFYTALRSVRLGSPRAVQQFHSGEFL